MANWSLARSAASLSLLLCELVASAAHAKITAHFQVQQVQSGCRVSDEDPIPFDEEPERFFRTAIFDASTSTVLDDCALGCSVDDLVPSTLDGLTLDHCAFNRGCDTWNFTDETLVKVVPPNQGVFFYFGLFDEDDGVVDQHDLLGDHWFFENGPSSGVVDNNNDAPYKPDDPFTTLCGELVRGPGHVDNFTLTYSSWFEDDTGPSTPATPVATDDGVQPVSWDNDTLLTFDVTAASDADSGIASYRYQLFDGGVEVADVTTSFLSFVNACTSGCTLDLASAPAHGDTFFLRVFSTNGNFPDIDNPATTFSAFGQVRVDLTSPTTSITSPAAGSWQDGAISVAVSDSDSGSGLDTCERRVVSNGVETQGWTARTCNSSTSVSVGEGLLCRDEGANECSVSVRSTDDARRTSTTVTRLFSVDFTADAIASLGAFASAGGDPLPEATWQPDDTPSFQWSPGPGTAPIDGYSIAIDTTPDCVVDLEGTFFNSVLAEGQHLFQVRVIDEAGNCGPLSAFELWVGDPPLFVDGFESGNLSAWSVALGDGVTSVVVPNESTTEDEYSATMALPNERPAPGQTWRYGVSRAAGAGTEIEVVLRADADADAEGRTLLWLELPAGAAPRPRTTAVELDETSHRLRVTLRRATAPDEAPLLEAWLDASTLLVLEDPPPR